MQVKNKLKNLIGNTLNTYNTYYTNKYRDLKFKEEYQGRIIDCMTKDVDDNYIITPETDIPIIKLENSKEGIVKVSTLKGKTILLNEYGVETQVPGQGCRLVSVGEEDDNKILIKSNNENNGDTIGKEHKIEFLLSEPLRSLPSGVCDEIAGDKLIRRVGKIVLDGSELWNVNATWSQADELTCWTTKIPPSKILKEGYLDVVSNMFSRNDSINYDGTEGMRLSIKVDSLNHNSYILYIKIKKDKLLSSDIDGLEAWLKSNPVEVLYELTEPIIEQLPSSIIVQGFDETTIQVENKITPIVSYQYNAIIPYKMAIASQQQESQINMLDIDNNIIPYLMDIEFNLMTMEDD